MSHLSVAPPGLSGMRHMARAQRRQEVASTGMPATRPQPPQSTAPVWPVSVGPDGASRRRLISAERSLSSACLVKVRSEGVGQLHEPQDSASTATPRGPHPLQGRIRPLTGRVPQRGHYVPVRARDTTRPSNPDLRKINRYLSLTFAAFGETGQRTCSGGSPVACPVEPTRARFAQARRARS